jgi:DNA-binding NarL/FixJ family response regulator
MDTLVEHERPLRLTRQVRPRRPETRSTVLVVERFPLVLQALTGVLDSVDELTVVGGANSVQTTLQLYDLLRPDLVVTDWTLNEPGDGGALGRALRDLPNPPKVLMYSSSNQIDVLAACLSGAADSFVYRGADTDKLLEVIASMHRGVPSWYAGGEQRGPGRDGRPEPTRGPNTVVGQLTAREQQILELLLRRYSNAEIADELYLAHQTVKNYVSTILQKLEVSSRRQLFAPVQRARPMATTIRPARRAG